jgi:hypothetical protein
MAFSKSKSRKCPVCIGCTPSKAEEIDRALKPLLADVKATGETPKANDSRLSLISHAVGIAPHSLRYHLKECLVDLEIQDQRFQELVDITEALSTAKQEYAALPTMGNSTAYTQLLTQFRELSKEIEGQTDPNVTVEFIVEQVLNALVRQTLASATEEIRALREQLKPMMSPNNHSFVDAQLKATLKRISTALGTGVDDGLKSLCEYYKVDLEAKARVRSLEVSTTSDSLFGPTDLTTDDDSVVH